MEAQTCHGMIRRKGGIFDNRDAFMRVMAACCCSHFSFLLFCLCIGADISTFEIAVKISGQFCGQNIF